MRIRPALAVTAALALAACGGQGKPVAEPSSSSTQPASPTSVASSPPSPTSTAVASSPAAAPAKGDIPSRDFVVGKWGTDGDCELAIDLRADGSSDGPFGDWAYSDGVISFPEDPGLTVSVTVIDDATMESVNGSSGNTYRMTRCP